MTATWKQMQRFTKGMIGWCAVWLALWAFTGFPSIALAQAVDLPPSTVSANDLWLVVYGILVALAVNALKQLPPDFTTWEKRGIAAFLSLVLSVVTLYYAGRLDLTDLAKTWLVVFIAASGVYTAFLRPATDALTGKTQT